MPNIPASVGFFTLTGRHTVGGADSTDPDDFPDAVGSNGTLVFTPQFPTSRPAVAVAEEEAVSIVEVTCRLNDGYIFAPADGVDGEAEYSTDPGVRLIASKQDALDPADWWWVAQFIPDQGEKWSGFQLPFQAKPGEALTIAKLLMQQPPIQMGVTYQQRWYLVTDFPVDPITSTNLPVGFRPGIDLLLNTTTKQYAEVY